MLNTKLANITQLLKNENKCYASAWFDALENECSLLKAKLQQAEQEIKNWNPTLVNMKNNNNNNNKKPQQQ